MWVGLSYCDGDWKRFKLAKRGSLISASVDDWAEETRGVGGPVTLRVDSPLYLGGVPMELEHASLDSQSHRHGGIICHTENVGALSPHFMSPFLSSAASSPTGLGGCIRGLTMHSDDTDTHVSPSINLSVASRRSVRVDLNGCPVGESRYNCRGNDSVLVYSGGQTQATDTNLQPFTGNHAHHTREHILCGSLHFYANNLCLLFSCLCMCTHTHTSVQSTCTGL